MPVIGPSRQAAFFGPTVANGALRTRLHLQLALPSRDDAVDGALRASMCQRVVTSNAPDIHAAGDIARILRRQRTVRKSSPSTACWIKCARKPRIGAQL
jgi:hypothetical protein